MSSKHSGLETTITLCLSLMIIVTIIGNILVCLSVVLVRKLRSPSNYLLVSLAISDLCVAILVMPLALNLEVKGYWDLGPTLCDMWVSFDVTSCTASILNLCMISVDRYLTITKPLTYGVKRTTKRMTAFIAIVWISSCLISVPPLLVLGNEHGTEEEPSCQVSQHIVYQLYATLGAFYIPLGVMIILYYKIYGAAKSVVDAELRSLGHTTDRLVPNSTTSHQHHPSAQSSQQSTVYHQQHNSTYHSRCFPALKPLLKPTITTSNNNKPIISSIPPPSDDEQSSDHHSLHKVGNNKVIADNSIYYQHPYPNHQNINYYSQRQQQQQQFKDSDSESFKETNFGEILKSPSSPTQTTTTTTTTSPPPAPQPLMPLTPNQTPPMTTITTTTTIKPTARNGLINCKDACATALTDVLLKQTSPKNSANDNNNNNNNNHNENTNSCEKAFHSSLLSSYKRVKESMFSSTRLAQSLAPSHQPSTHHHSLQNKYHCIVQQSTNNQQGNNNNQIDSTINNSSSSAINNNNNNINCSNFGGVRKSLGDRLSFHATLSSGAEKRRTSSMLKERKASITLGVIMTAFTACWLPFFILALLRPFSVTVNQIPPWISSLCYWLGLTNSMLNPIIYVTFHHDFRKAFRYLLCLQCSTMDFRLRERAYQSQYGINNSSENHLHHLPPSHHQYYTHPPPPSSHVHPSSQSQFTPHSPSPPPTTATTLNHQPAPLSPLGSTSQSNLPISSSGYPSLSGSSEERHKPMALKENLIPVNYSVTSLNTSQTLKTLKPLTSNSIDERLLLSQQEHLLSKHTPL